MSKQPLKSELRHTQHVFCVENMSDKNGEIDIQ